MELTKKIEKYQTVEKASLIVVGTTLVSSGMGWMEKNSAIGLTLVILGVVCLVGRELLKLKK